MVYIKRYGNCVKFTKPKTFYKMTGLCRNELSNRYRERPYIDDVCDCHIGE